MKTGDDRPQGGLASKISGRGGGLISRLKLGAVQRIAYSSGMGRVGLGPFSKLELAQRLRGAF